MNELLPDFFHRRALELVREMPAIGAGQPDSRTAPQLIGALRRNVHEQKPAVDRRRRLRRLLRLGIVRDDVVGHSSIRQVITRGFRSTAMAEAGKQQAGRQPPGL
jgi:hypothetical protein